MDEQTPEVAGMAAGKKRGPESPRCLRWLPCSHHHHGSRPFASPEPIYANREPTGEPTGTCLGRGDHHDRPELSFAASGLLIQNGRYVFTSTRPKGLQAGDDPESGPVGLLLTAPRGHRRKPQGATGCAAARSMTFPVLGCWRRDGPGARGQSCSARRLAAVFGRRSAPVRQGSERRTREDDPERSGIPMAEISRADGTPTRYGRQWDDLDSEISRTRISPFRTCISSSRNSGALTLRNFRIGGL